METLWRCTVSDDGIWDGDGSQPAPPPHLDQPAPVRIRPDALVAVQANTTRADDHSEQDNLSGVIATGAVHELNNLLTIALGSLEQLRRQALDERGQTQLDRAQWGVEQAGRVARQMLSLARREASQPKIADLNAIVGEFDKIMDHAAKDRSTLVVELNPAPLPVCLDPAQLELALINLVRNASDAMGGDGSIVLRTAGHRVDGLGGQPTVEVSVTDTGSGMSPEVVKRATKSFFTTKAPGRGTGLGLWMVERFMTACGGKLVLETAMGQGTTVRLVFPRAE